MKNNPKYSNKLLNNVEKEGISLFLIFFIFSLILFFLNIFVPKNRFYVSMSSFVTDISIPVIYVINSPFKFIGENISSIIEYKFKAKEYQNLKLENESLRFWANEAIRLQNQLREIEKIIDARLFSTNDFIICEVIMESNGPYEDSMIINLGRRDNVKIGDAILNSKGLIGYVINISENTSRVLLINDVNSSISVEIEGLNINAIMSGNNYNYPSLKYLDNEENLTLKGGEKVFTSGLEDRIAKKIPIGEIIVTQDREYLVKPYANPNESDIVTLVKNNFNNEFKGDEL